MTATKETIPYTYLIGWKQQNMFYYGVRYAKGCNPREIMKTYFTSSKHVKRFTIEYGNPDIIQIRKTFSNSISAITWENKVLRRMMVVSDLRFLNKTYNKGIPPEIAGHTKGRTYEDILGNERAIVRKEQTVQSNRNRVGIKYKSMNRSYSSNDIKICCIHCKYQTSASQFTRHIKKCNYT